MEQKQYEVLRGFMNHLTKDYLWYYDTPEKRFKWSPGSIWLIKPETKEWVIELDKGGRLWWYSNFYVNFQRYFNMEPSDYEKFIKIWVEDVLNRGVSSTQYPQNLPQHRVEDVLNQGVFSTRMLIDGAVWKVKDILNRGTYIKDCMGVDGGIKNHYLYLMEKSVYDDFQNKVDERVIEHIFNTTEK